MQVKDIMHRGAAAIAPQTSVAQIARKMRDMDIGVLPVVDAGEVVGIVTDRNVTIRAVAEGKDMESLAAKDVMSRDVLCCHDTDDLHRALRAMENARVRRMPVLDQAGSMIGMVSLGDVATSPT